MSSLQSYVIVQETEWAGRRFCTARDRRTNHSVYLVGEPLGMVGGTYAHPNLPALKELGVEPPTRWWVGQIPEGEKLEDLRLQGSLTESDLLSALLSTVDALLNLAATIPPMVPVYIDPACIVRDRLGRWQLDYLALAHAPEAHAKTPEPLGVYPFGVLLYWVVTGETIRRSRPQVSQLESLASPGLQLLIIRCLGRSYPSLAELRAELARAGKDREFQPLIQRVRARAQAARSEAARQFVRAPHIPLDDRPWAAPPAPRGGYSRGALPLQYQRVRRPWKRWLGTLIVGLFTFVLAAGTAVKLGLVPEQYLPVWLRSVPTVTVFPKPELVHPVYAEAQMVPQRVMLFLNGEKRGDTYIYTSPNHPYIDVTAMNRLLSRKLEWVVAANGQVVLQEGDRSLVLPVSEQIGDTLWIKLLPIVQEWLGMRFQSYRGGILHFSSKA